MGNELARIYSDHIMCNPSKDCRPVRISDLQRVQKNRSSRFSKRRRNFLKKAHDQQKDCEVDVYLCVRSRKNNKIWQYSSEFTPPSQDEMVWRTRQYLCDIFLTCSRLICTLCRLYSVQMTSPRRNIAWRSHLAIWWPRHLSLPVLLGWRQSRIPLSYSQLRLSLDSLRVIS